MWKRNKFTIASNWFPFLFHHRVCFLFFFLFFRIGFFSHFQSIQVDEQNNDPENAESVTDLVQGFVHSVNVDINELTNQNKCIDLQHTFRPIFVQFFKTNLYHRYKAVTFRRVLAEKGFDLKSLEDVWTEKKKVSRFFSLSPKFYSHMFRFIKNLMQIIIYLYFCLTYN